MTNDDTAPAANVPDLHHHALLLLAGVHVLALALNIE